MIDPEHLEIAERTARGWWHRGGYSLDALGGTAPGKRVGAVVRVIGVPADVYPIAKEQAKKERLSIGEWTARAIKTYADR